jgi:hypothetical protein
MSMSRETNYSSMLIEFLAERDAPCPRCGYNLRNLTQPACPECNADLMLKVGLQHPVVHWLLLTLAPSTFCALSMMVFIVMSVIHGIPGRFPLAAMLTIGFLIVSGLAGIALALGHRWFMRRREAMQKACAAITWLIHVAAFLAFALSA